MIRKNVPSSYIAVEINNAIFGLLGEKSLSLATGFAEIFSTNEQQDGWIKLGAGVICYVKDYSQRNVTLRFFNIDGQVREIWNASVAPEDLFFKDTPNFVVFTRNDGILFGINFTYPDEAEGFYAKVQQLQSRRPQRLSSHIDNDGRTTESASVPVTQSSAARCDARRISNDAFRRELSAVIIRNRDQALSRTTIPSSRVSSVTVKWMHEGTYRRFTWSYDDECDAYQALRDELNRFKSNFNGRLEWNDSDGDWIEFSSDSELRHAINESHTRGILHIQTIGSVQEQDNPAEKETSQSPLSSMSSKNLQALRNPPPLDKKDIGKPSEFKHLIHISHDGTILEGVTQGRLKPDAIDHGQHITTHEMEKQISRSEI